MQLAYSPDGVASVSGYLIPYGEGVVSDALLLAARLIRVGLGFIPASSLHLYVARTHISTEQAW